MRKLLQVENVAARTDCRAVGADTTSTTRASSKSHTSRRNTIATNKKLFFLSGCLFLLLLGSKAQTGEAKNVHYPYNTQIGVNFNMNMLSKMKIEPLYEMYNHELVRMEDDLLEYFRSYPSVGTDFGVYLYQRVYKWFGIQLGVEYNLTTVCYSYKFDNDESKTVNMDYMNGGFSFPVSLNAFYYFNEKHGMDISLGGVSSFNWFTGGLGGHRFKMGSWEDGDYCSFGLDPLFFSYSLYGKLGYNFLFKNKNTLGIAIIGHLVGSYASGQYTVRKGWEVDKGYTYSHNTSVGLQFSYGFTLKKSLRE